MIELNFMSGALFVTFIYTFLQFFLIFVIGMVSWRIYKNYKKHETYEETVKNSKVDIFALVFMLFSLLVVNPATMPKREMVTITNPAQHEYNTPKDIDIITPPSRTERLDGFRPLKED